MLRKKVYMLELLSLFMLTSFTALYTAAAFAQATVPANPIPAPVAPGDFFNQVLAFIQSWGGIPTILKVAGIITILVASMKVTYLNTLIWSKLGGAQVYVAPALGLIAGILGIGNGGAAITAASIFAYVSAGAGAVFLHEILDSVKVIPGIGAIYVTIITIVEGALGGGTPAKPS